MGPVSGWHCVNARVTTSYPPDIGPESPPEDESRLRTPPHSVEAEHSTIGGLLIEPTAMGRIADVVAEGDFYRHEHRTIFGVIANMATAGQPIDVITVFEQLQAMGKAAEVGGLAYLNDLATCVPSAANIARYAQIVAERATARAVIAAADDMATAAFNLRGRPVSGLLDAARTKLSQIQEQRRVGGARRLPVLTGPQLIEEASSMTWLCDGIFPEQSLGMLYGASGTFKSFLALDAALHIVHGLPWMGRRTEQGPVLWIAAEGGKSFGHRVNAWHRARRLQPSTQLVGIPASIDLGTEAWRVVDAVQSTVAITPRLVVVDTLSQTYTAGGEENSATDMAGYLREIGARFRDLWKCTVVVVHHSGHTATERPRGSSAIQANTDFLFGCWRDEKEMLATLSCQHMKDGDRFDDATFVLNKVDLGVDRHGRPFSHLAARHLSNAEEVEQAQQTEQQAGRGGKRSLLLTLAQNGMRYDSLRKAFYEDCGLTSPDAQRQAFHRALNAAKKSGALEVAEGFILMLGGKK